MNADFVEEIYNNHYSLVKLIIKNSIHTPNDDDITSCVQDVFVVAMQKEGLENHVCIEGWLLKTAKNIVNDFNRKNAIRNKYYDFSAEFNDFEPWIDDSSDLVIEKIHSERLKGVDLEQLVVDLLTESEKIFYELLRYKKLDFKEISKVLNISETAAASRRTRLKEKIKKILKNL